MPTTKTYSPDASRPRIAGANLRPDPAALMASGSLPVAACADEAKRNFTQRLMWARVGFVCAQTLLLAATRSSYVEMPWLLMMTCLVGAAAAASLMALLHLRRVAMLDDPAMLRHLLADLGVLSYMLAISGGAENPFHDAFFLPVAVAACTTAPAFAWRVAASTVVCYTLVHFVYVPLPGTAETLARTHFAGEWLTHVLLAALSTYLLSVMVHNMRQCERRLAEAHGSAARAECAVAVGSIAAGAAHELSTPMTTIATGLAELRTKYGADPDLRERLDVIDSGVAECRKALEVLRQAKGPSLALGRSMAVHEFVDEIIARLRAMQPTCEVRCVLEGPGAAPVILADLALQQAVMNLLVNAMQASPAGVQLTTRWTEFELAFRVTDSGPGIPPDVLKQLGLSFITTKPRGSGMGVFLTRVTAHRLGGSFSIRNAPERGVVAEILLPLALITPKRT